MVATDFERTLQVHICREGTLSYVPVGARGKQMKINVK